MLYLPGETRAIVTEACAFYCDSRRPDQALQTEEFDRRTQGRTNNRMQCLSNDSGGQDAPAKPCPQNTRNHLLTPSIFDSGV